MGWYWHCSKTHRGSSGWNASCGMPEVLDRIPVPKLWFLSLETDQHSTEVKITQKLGEGTRKDNCQTDGSKCVQCFSLGCCDRSVPAPLNEGPIEKVSKDPWRCELFPMAKLLSRQPRDSSSLWAELGKAARVSAVALTSCFQCHRKG